jgi:hypothetical protein
MAVAFWVTVNSACEPIGVSGVAVATAGAVNRTPTAAAAAAITILDCFMTKSPLFETFVAGPSDNVVNPRVPEKVPLTE